MKARQQAWAVLGLFLAAIITLVVHDRSASKIPAVPAPDLLRLDFPRAGWVVEEHSPTELEVGNDRMIIGLQAMTSTQAADHLATWKGMMQNRRDHPATSGGSRWILDNVTRAGSPTVYRLLRGFEEPNRAGQAEYLVDFEGKGWASVAAISRDDATTHDVVPFEDFLLSLHLRDLPELAPTARPAWEVYQATRRPGTPVAKFSLYMDPAPVRIGDIAGSDARHDPSFIPFTHREWEQGGRQLDPTLFEFYSKGDPTSIRVDLWTEPPPPVADREPIFTARLRIEKPRTQISSFVDPFDAPIPPGDYDVAVTVVHRGEVQQNSPDRPRGVRPRRPRTLRGRVPPARLTPR